MNTIATYSHQPWNKGKLVGQKAPLRPRDIWAIRVRLQIAEKVRDLALFDLAMRKKGTDLFAGRRPLLAASSQSPESAFERRWPPGQIRAPAVCNPQPQLLGAAAQVQHLRRYADDQRQQQAELRADQQW